MPWVKLDDSFYDNPKVIIVGNEATGAYCRLLSYCGRHLTDGFIPADKFAEITKRPKVGETLIHNKLVEELDNGFWIPDYLDFNMESEKAQEERLKAKERMAKLRAERRTAMQAKRAGGSGV